MSAGVHAYVVDVQGDFSPATPDARVAHYMDLEAELAEFAIDGSCSKPVLATLQRAGWAITLLDPGSDAP
eukprot:5893890-Pyramimonas_sp.AAC.1